MYLWYMFTRYIVINYSYIHEETVNMYTLHYTLYYLYFELNIR